ncbi:MAG: bifunctional UDP-sugar hydrolase/5'-nucleotidase [Myxococcota bacterium]|nr:bifunctional UDP-sugar hydrolase/5'-nucleotidase [Myxococcota bacterium]
MIVSSPRSRLLLLAIGISLMAACGAQTRHLQVIHTTDVHGYYGMPSDPASPGGLERLAGVVEAARARGPVLLVDSGDMWSGTQLSDRTEGALGVAAYNLLGYDAVALGNHEFDYGPLGARREGGSDPFGALKARLEEAHFAVLAANLRLREGGGPVPWPGLSGSVIVERGGFRVGLVGVVTEDTPSITFPHVGDTLEFQVAHEAVAREAEALRTKGAEIVFVLAHIGGRCDEHTDPEDLSSCVDQSPIFQLVRELPEGLVDAVFGGHTHRNIAHRVSGTPVLQGGRYGRAVSMLNVSAAGEEMSLSFDPPQVLEGPVPRTRLGDKVEALLGPFESELRDIRGERLGARLVRPLSRSASEGGRLGAFFCDVLMEEIPDHDLCILNSGGLRKNLPEGDVTYGALYDVLPFGNRPATLEISGRVLRQILQISTSGAHGLPQVAGVQITVHQGQDPCPTMDRSGDGEVGRSDRDRLHSVTTSDGEAIDPDKTYRVLTNSFLARGGDHWRATLSAVHPDRKRVLVDELPVRDLIAGWMRRVAPILNSPDNPLIPDVRVVLKGTNSDAACPELKAPSAGHGH